MPFEKPNKNHGRIIGHSSEGSVGRYRTALFLLLFSFLIVQHSHNLDRSHRCAINRWTPIPRNASAAAHRTIQSEKEKEKDKTTLHYVNAYVLPEQSLGQKYFSGSRKRAVFLSLLSKYRTGAHIEKKQVFVWRLSYTVRRRVPWLTHREHPVLLHKINRHDKTH